MAGTQPARLPQTRFGFALVDVETTGLDLQHDRVIEIAVRLMDVDGTVTQDWSTLVHTRRDPGPVHIHGLTADHLADAPTFAQLAPELARLLDGRILVAHNAEFDWGFLSREAARVGMTLPVSERLCTVNLARRLHIDAPNFKLSTLASHWGVDVGTAHQASDDVATLAEVLRFCLAEAGQQGAALPLEPCEMPSGLGWTLRRQLARLRRPAPAAPAYRRSAPARSGASPANAERVSATRRSD